MSDRYNGGVIKSVQITTSRFGTNSGMFTLGQQFSALLGDAWPSDYNASLKFTDSGSWECPTDVTEIEYLIVGGGGGAMGGGAGAGGIRLGSGLPVTAGQTYTISVGAGGSGGAQAPSNSYPSPIARGTNGFGSSIAGAFASPISPIAHIGTNGGALGASRQEGPVAAASYGHSGGSGGGSGQDRNDSGDNNPKGQSIALTTANGHPGSITGENVTRGSITQGFSGGRSISASRGGAGGGGGAGQAGFNGGSGAPDGAPTSGPEGAGGYGGNGGNGIASTISGTSEYFGGGGGGGCNTDSGPAAATVNLQGRGGLGGGGNGSAVAGSGVAAQGNSATINTGGGGGGCEYNCDSPLVGGSGGSGIVLIKYKNKITNRVFSFTGGGIWKNNFGAKEIEYLVVAGGGGGGSNNAGGGGAGGFRIGTGLAVAAGSYPVTVGAGGAGGPEGGDGTNGTVGNNSSLAGPSPFTTITSAGGG